MCDNWTEAVKASYWTTNCQFRAFMTVALSENTSEVFSKQAEDLNGWMVCKKDSEYMKWMQKWTTVSTHTHTHTQYTHGHSYANTKPRTVVNTKQVMKQHWARTQTTSLDRRMSQSVIHSDRVSDREHRKQTRSRSHADNKNKHYIKYSLVVFYRW